MLGKGDQNPADVATLKINGNLINTPEEKASTLLELYSSFSPTNIAPNAFYRSRIGSAVSSQSPFCLNFPITQDEIAHCLSKSKSRSLGIDLIHNDMLANLSPVNKENVRHLFNLCYLNAYVPEE